MAALNANKALAVKQLFGIGLRNLKLLAGQLDKGGEKQQGLHRHLQGLRQRAVQQD